jgi:hypothetical protein
LKCGLYESHHGKDNVRGICWAGEEKLDRSLHDTGTSLHSVVFFTVLRIQQYDLSSTYMVAKKRNTMYFSVFSHSLIYVIVKKIYKRYDITVLRNVTAVIDNML